MPTTSFFQPARFLRLLRAHWAEQRRSYSFFWLIVAFVHALLMLLLLVANNGRAGKTEVQEIVYWWGLIASGAVLGGMYFAALRRPSSALVLLTRPASVFEKWLMAALFVLLLWPTAYTLSSLLINGAAASMGYALEVRDRMMSNLSADVVEAYKYTLFFPSLVRGEHLALLLFYTGLSGFTLLGSIYFRKSQSIKTGVVAFIVFLLTILLLILLDRLAKMEANPRMLLWWRFTEDLSAQSWHMFAANISVWLMTPALLWACALLALREKDLA